MQVLSPVRGSIGTPPDFSQGHHLSVGAVSSELSEEEMPMKRSSLLNLEVRTQNEGLAGRNQPVIARKRGIISPAPEQESRISALLNWLLHCRHRTISRVFDLGEGPYVVCMDCGEHIPYDWRTG